MILYARFYELLPLISFIASIFLISLVLRSDWRSAQNRVFALFLLTMGLWGLTIFGMRSSPHPDGMALAFMWEKGVIAVVLGVAVLFYHFSLLYTRTQAPWGLLPGFYLLWIVFALLSPFGLIVSGMEEVTLFGGYLGWSARFTGLGVFYLAAGYVPTWLAIGNLARACRRTRSPEEKNRTLYMLIGAILSLAGATSDFFFAKGLLFYPFGIVANLLFAGLTTEAILKYQLLELRAVLRRGVPYTLLGVLIASIYGAVFALFSFLFQSQSDFARLLATIAAATLVAIGLQPLLGRAQSWADRWFDRKRYDQLQALQEFSLETKDITDLKALSHSLTGLVSHAMLADSASLLLPAGRTPEFYVASSAGLKDVEELSLKMDSPILSWLRHSDDILTKASLEEMPYFRALAASDKELMDALKADLLIPLKAKGQLTGLLVAGPKLSEEDYSANDVNLLQAVSTQTSMAIENARLYAQESERLEELERLEMLKQTLLLTVSHELKTPLTAIKAGTEMLQMQEDSEPTSIKGRLYHSINRGVDRLERLIDESLDYAKMQDATLELDFQPTDLKELYQEIMALAMPPARAKRHTLSLEVPDSAPTVFVDRRRCERILLNLISNATKYTEPGGSISVGVQVEPTYLITSVVDTGQGVPESDLDTIFNVYYRNGAADGRGAGQSSGLGLAIAKYLVELHGGRIWVESEVGVGSTFCFTTPLGSHNEDSSD